MQIYKVFRAGEWAQLQRDSHTAGAPVDVTDGYIHFSTAAQLRVTLSKHFGREGDLTLLACDPQALVDDLVWEPSRGGDLFPHLYRDLRMTDILWSRDIGLTPQGHDVGEIE
ncbi:DUF952 domain-containing protein [Paracoccus sp. JM45]|uniref:DUF952 domain-containing protein n=1 Tax=Paracoccus sp. JM45 TaxID=2283626 RepID=UPI000E6BE5DE|nr:DUF952 domain-containing protein [Paracoccus sp. JM45]RJE81219.1 DUF952 domain-containing protein [Paracoccus sp. JM45]